ncbi:MAG: heme-binding protein [Actinobacteria bacterium]|nr:heme-binding protein [Actinomycetota bacterium]
MSFTTADALEIVAAAQIEAATLGVSVTCCVFSADARELATVRMDGAGWFTPDIARSKATSAATMGSDSGDLAKLIDRHPELNDLIGDQLPVPFTTLAGAVAVRSDGVVIGAVGVSGATSEQDVTIARAAVATWTAAHS